jgi:hypothetical protein
MTPPHRVVRTVPATTRHLFHPDVATPRREPACGPDVRPDRQRQHLAPGTAAGAAKERF